MERDSQDSQAIPQGGQDSSSDPARPAPRFSLIRHLWSDYPLVLWSALWTLMLVLAAIAMSGLLNPDLSQPIHATRPTDRSGDPRMLDDPVVGQAVPPVAVASPPHEDSPLWPLTLLFITCGLGCWTLSLQLKRRTAQTWQPVAAPLPEELLEEKHGAIAPYQPMPPKTSAVQRLVTLTDAMAASPPTETSAPVAHPSLPASSRPAFEMPQQSRLRELDRRAPGLAELLDIQRRRDQKPMGRTDNSQE